MYIYSGRHIFTIWPNDFFINFAFHTHHCHLICNLNEYTSLCVAYLFFIYEQSVPSKHETLNQCWFNVGPPSTTSAQHWTNIGLMSHVCWVCRILASWNCIAHLITRWREVLYHTTATLSNAFVCTHGAGTPCHPSRTTVTAPAEAHPGSGRHGVRDRGIGLSWNLGVG